MVLLTALVCCLQFTHFWLEEPACAEDHCPMMPKRHFSDDMPEIPHGTGLLQQRTKTSTVQVKDASGRLDKQNATALVHVKDAERLLRPKLAVLIAGRADRLVLAPKIRHVMEPVAAKGWDVDLYVSVVGMDKGSHKAWAPIPNNVSAVVAERLESVAAIQTLATAGSWAIRFCELDGDSQEVVVPKDPPRRLSLYPPSETEVGLNVLRRFKATEQLMHKVKDVEMEHGFSYDFVLLTKDDDHWLGPLDISRFQSNPTHPNDVYFKDCLRFSGVNDKTLLFGRRAAEAVLTRLYSDFWEPRREFVTGNIEHFWRNFLVVNGADMRPASFSLLPTCDSIYVKGDDGTPYLCQKKFYMCKEYADLPQDGSFEQPEFCPAADDAAWLKMKRFSRSWAMRLWNTLAHPLLLWQV